MPCEFSRCFPSFRALCYSDPLLHICKRGWRSGCEPRCAPDPSPRTLLQENRLSILVNKNTRVLVQGITGKEGTFHTKQMIDYGTNIVGGVTPGKGGTTHEGVPIFNT